MINIRNILIVWMLTGIWHGASWNFAIWGLYFGLILILEKLFILNLLKKMPTYLSRIYTLILVFLSWVIFAFDSLREGINYIKILFGLSGTKFLDNTSLYLLYTNILLFLILIIGSTDIPKRLWIYISDKFEDKINKFLENLYQYNKDITISSLLVPTKSGVLKDKLPLYVPIIDEKDIVDRLNSSIKDNMNIMDLKDGFGENSNEYIYYKTDHHWTSMGAFYAYQYYMTRNGDLPLGEEDFIITKVSDDFLGTSYRKANLYLGNPDEIHTYKPKKEIEYKITINNEIKTNSLYDESYLNKVDKYSYFLGGDKALIEIETSIKNDKNILLIKDSFVNSFIPFLTNHYENISIVDPRYFNTSIIDYIKEKDIDEVLFLFNVQNFVQEKSFDVVGK